MSGRDNKSLVSTTGRLLKFVFFSGLLMATISPASATVEEDPSCADVNYSYAARSSWFYSAKLYDVRSDGSLKQIGEMRSDKDTSYTVDVRKGIWTRGDRMDWTLLDVDGPKFRSCVLIGEGKEKDKRVKHYRATWHLDPAAAYADIWFWSENKQMVRLKRRFTDQNQANLKFGIISGTLMEKFDYDPTTGVAPDGPFEP
jgi:hypothetical protein